MLELHYEIYIPTDLTDVSKCQVVITEKKDGEYKTYELNGKSCQITQNHFRIQISPKLWGHPSDPTKLTEMFIKCPELGSVSFHPEETGGSPELTSISMVVPYARAFLKKPVDVETNPHLKFLVDTIKSIRDRGKTLTFQDLCAIEWRQVYTATRSFDTHFYGDYINYYDYMLNVNQSSTKEERAFKIKQRRDDLENPIKLMAGRAEFNQKLREAREHLEKNYMPIFLTSHLADKSF